MRERQLILAILAAAEEVPSRTMLQKLVYLLNARVGAGLDFSAHFFGPYSTNVQFELKRLASTGIIAEQGRLFDLKDENQFDSIQCSYRLSAQATDFLAEVPKDIVEQAKETVRISRQYWSPAPLSVAAKLHYLHQVDPTLSTDVMPIAAEGFGWQITRQQAEEGARLFQDLGLAS